jgi:hypothetical protein
MDNPFAQVPGDRESMVVLVLREASEEWQAARLPPPDLDACVREAVETLWESEVRTFVPLLALRRVRACIRAGTCDSDEW